MRDLARVLAELEAGVAAGAVHAVVLRSSHASIFCAGASAAEMNALHTRGAAEVWARDRQQLLRRLERLSVPTVAAVDGLCLGAGAELVLACGYRIGSVASRTRLGFPQVRGGTLPAWGGTVRLPRLLGLQPALELMFGGAAVGAEAARQLGLLDEVFPEARFLAQVRRYTEQRVRRGRAATGARRTLLRRLVEDTAPGRRVLRRRTTKWLRPRALAHHPDAAAVLDTVLSGAALPLEQAFQREAETFAQVVASPGARGFLHLAAAREGADLAADGTAPPAPVQEAAVLGATPFGARVAHLLTLHGVSVRLRDTRREELSRGVRHAHRLLEDEVERGTLAEQDLAPRQHLLTGTRGFGRFGTLDLVLDVEEDRLDAPPPALASVAEHVREDCLLAWTSALRSVAELQRQVAHPERVLGLHFLPVPRTGLVEVVPGPLTSAGCVHRAAALVRRLGKTPVVVADVPGLVAFRLLAPYFGEAARLVEQGASAEQTDAAMRAFGMGVGPLRLLDELGIDAAAEWMRMLAGYLGRHLAPPPLLKQMVDAGRTGKAAREGFYRYAADGRRQPNPGQSETISAAEAAPLPLDAETIQQRLVLAMINEAGRLCGEGVVRSAAEVDLVSVLGAGFPVWRGGILYHAEQQGLHTVHQQLCALAEQQGDRFRPAAWLQRRVDGSPAASGQNAAGRLHCSAS